MMDFSENFVHVTQDEIQKAFFDQTSSTIFTTMLYFEDNGQVSSEPYCILSDFKGYQGSKGHDKYAVSHYTRILVKDFQNRHPNFDLQKIEFLSDGTGQHFKQKYSLCQVLTLNFPHLTVIWNFSPTSHVKGPIDGIGGTLKRRVTEKVMGMRGKVKSTVHFSKLAEEVCPSVRIRYISGDDTVQFIEDAKLIEGWTKPSEIKTTPNTHDQHYFRGLSPYIVCSNIYSGREGDKVHVFRKQVTEPSTQEEVCEPDTSVNTEKEDEDFVVRITTTSFQPRDWCLVHLKTSNTRYIAQLLTEAPAQKNHFDVDYYKVVPLTGNTTFAKCGWPDEDPVHIGDFERKVDPPKFPKVLKGRKLSFPRDCLMD